MQFGRHICSGVDVSKVECMYISAPGHLVYCGEVI